jgi:hypothetical protein
MFNLFNSLSKGGGAAENGSPAGGDMMKIIEGMDKSGSMKNMSGLFNMLPTLMKAAPQGPPPQPRQADAPRPAAPPQNRGYESYNTGRPRGDSAFAADQAAAMRQSRACNRRNGGEPARYSPDPHPQDGYSGYNSSARPVSNDGCNPDGQYQSRDEKNGGQAAADYPPPDDLQYINTAPKYKTAKRKHGAPYKR